MRLRSDKTSSDIKRIMRKLPLLAEQVLTCPLRRNDIDATLVSLLRHQSGIEAVGPGDAGRA